MTVFVRREQCVTCCSLQRAVCQSRGKPGAPPACTFEAVRKAVAPGWLWRRGKLCVMAVFCSGRLECGQVGRSNSVIMVEATCLRGVSRA